MNLIIAEIGSVHDGSFGNACRLIEAAAAAGANAVKFQTHIPEAESLPDAPAPAYFLVEPRTDYFRRTSFSLEQWRQLSAGAKGYGLLFLSSPFSLEAVDLLESVPVEAYKIPSGEVTNLPLLERVAATGKSVLLSSGMSNWLELDAAVETLRKGGPVTMLQCSSIYPCPPQKVGLNVLAEMRARYNLPVGLSDHSLGFAAPIAAAALGATVIEKHFTFSRQMYGSDAQHSMEPHEFKVLTAALREVWVMLSEPVNKNDLSPYAEMKRIFEKSIASACHLPAGTVLRREHLAFKKPGGGISAAQYRKVLGLRTTREIQKDCKFQEGDLS